MLVCGRDDDAVAGITARVAALLERDPIVVNRFNMLVLRRRGDEARVVTGPHRSADLVVTTDGHRVSGGAFDVAGRRVVEAAAPAVGFVPAWKAFLRQSTVGADEIAGLVDAVAPTTAAPSTVLQLRFRR